MKTLGGLFGAIALVFLGRAVGEPAAPPKPEVAPEPVVVAAAPAPAPTPMAMQAAAPGGAAPGQGG